MKKPKRKIYRSAAPPLKGYENCPAVINGKNVNDDVQYGELFREYRRTGSPEFRKQLLAAAIPYVIAVTKKYSHLGSREDLIGYGFEGLVKFFDKKFDPDTMNFRSYAGWHIQRAILENVEKDKMMGLSEDALKKSGWIKNAGEEFYKNHGRNPTTRELAKLTYLPEWKIEELAGCSEPLSLNFAYHDKESKERSLMDKVSDSTSPSPLEVLSSKDITESDKILAWRFLDSATLIPRDREMVMKRFGLNGYNHSMTQQELADEYGLTRARVGQILGRANKKMKAAAVGYEWIPE
ncbi:MAG TPA: sigma-70 family RNA polymerase sigma factor [Candidatus Omnitrophota bacterium]|nr:sigma-70 family RNA polymerase sigma factor [Candidatus Omnitrophota bacterium]